MREGDREREWSGSWLRDTPDGSSVTGLDIARGHGTVREAIRALEKARGREREEGK